MMTGGTGLNAAYMRRHRLTRGALKATTALFGAPGARVLVATALVSAAAILPAQADDWTAFFNDDWFLPGNWADGSTPTSHDTVTIDAGASRPAIIDTASGVAEYVFVGQTGIGDLTIQKGGSLADDHSFIGFDAGSTGHATVTGAGSTWTNTDYLSIGGNGAGNVAAGTGILDIEDGGTVRDTSGFIANNGFGTPGTVGTATINGAGSRWINSADLFVAYQGEGTLTIENQGTASDNNGYIGYVLGSKGTATVTGAGSTWKNNSTLYIGGSGDGTLTIENGGTVSDSNGSVAAGVLSTGAVTVKGAGSKWTNTVAVYVGEHGIGTVTVEDGGAVIDFDGFIGNGIDTAGTATVTGAGSTWTNSGGLSVSGATVISGNLVGGTLMIEDGGAVSDVNGTIGDNAGLFGTATVTGAGSTWTNSKDLSVEGNGSLTVEDGGAVGDVGGSIGNSVGVEGSATVTGAGSTWANSGKLSVGGLAHYSTLTIKDGGAVSDIDGIIGGAAGTTNAASVTGSGSTWTNSGDLSVGESGDSQLVIEDGGAVSDVNGSIGVNAGTTGVGFVIGAGSTWANSGDLSVGKAGLGGLGVEDGGAVSDVNGSIGVNAGSTGVGAVTGAGTKWTSSGLFFVGDGGDGTLTVEKGGAVSDNFGEIGGHAGSTGTATITGAGSTWTNSSGLSVGQMGNGTLTIKNGGAVGSQNGTIGAVSGSTGVTTVTGTGSKWTIGNNFDVGEFGTGTLTVTNGGRVDSYVSNIGEHAGSVGSVAVTGAGSKWTNTWDFYVGDSGAGMLTIAHSGTLVTNFEASIGYAAGSTGAATVTGVGSTWVDAAALNIGRSGIGTLTIEDGGTISDNTGALGLAPGSTGTATVTGGGSKWINAEVLVGGAGAGMLTITDGGAVTANFATAVAAAAGSQGTLNIGAAAGDPPATPGTLDTPQLLFGPGTGTLVFNHTSSAYSFTSALSGKGAVDAIAGTTLLTGTSGGFTGAATVDVGATLGIDGTLGGTLDVLAGGRLEGTGTAGTTTVSGTIAPGHSIGTLHVSGNYTQVVGSTYEVELDSTGSSDLIDVTGKATLNGGTVDVVPYPDYAIATPYTILTAASGVTGSFAGASGSYISAFLAPKLTYDANDAFLTIAQSASFASAGLTPNEKAAAAGADSTGPGNPVWNAIALLPSTSDAPAAFDAVSGEIHASVKTGLIDESHFIRDAVIGRLRGTIAGDPGVAPANDGKGNRLPAPAGDRFGVWAHGFGSWGRWDGDGNAATLDRTIGGIFIGGDAVITDDWRLGLAAGYSRSSFDVDGRASSADVDSYTIAAYGGGHIGGLGLRFGAANTWHSIDTSRSIAFPGFADTASASYDARTAQVFGDVGYTIRAGCASFEPFADLAYVNLHTDGYRESGSAGLTAGSDNTDVTYMTLGLRAATSFDLGGMKAAAHGTLGWRHAFGDTTPFATEAFAGGTAFTVAGVPIAKDAAVVKAGLDFSLSPSAALSLSYAGQIGNGTTDQGGNATFSVRF